MSKLKIIIKYHYIFISQLTNNTKKKENRKNTKQNVVYIIIYKVMSVRTFRLIFLSLSFNIVGI